MDYLAKRIIEKLKARGDAERQRAEEWQRSLKPTIYRGNNLFQELGGEPIEGRYLGQVGLVPGQSVPNIARNPNKPVIPGLPLPPAEAIEDEVYIAPLLSDLNGLFIVFDSSWLDLPTSNSYNIAILKDIFFNPRKKVKYLNDSRIDVGIPGLFDPITSVQDQLITQEAISELEYTLEPVISVPSATKDSVFVVPTLNRDSGLSVKEYSSLKRQSKIGKVLIIGEYSTIDFGWDVLNTNHINGMGIGGLLTSPVYTNINPIFSFSSPVPEGLLNFWTSIGGRSISSLGAQTAYSVQSPAIGLFRGYPATEFAQVEISKYVFIFIPSSFF